MTLGVVGLLSWPWLQTAPAAAPSHEDPDRHSCAGFYRPAATPRRAVFSVEHFGAVGDGRTSNTEAFRKAVRHLESFGDKGGSQLNVPRGRWLTGSFNLTSNFTLFLEEGAVILGSQDPGEWPVIDPLPSYGRGRERLGGRHISLIHGDGLSDVVVTGQNGSIDGQGKIWWDFWWNRTLQHTRGHLLELVNSNNILISNLTFLNSPFWTIHPVYCSYVVLKDLTVLAPLHSPNTDGIDPDSSSHVCIEDCYIESGDDLVAVKSGWDQYGISVARPSTDIIIRRVSGTTPTCSGIGIGSEMSGGVNNVVVEGLHVWDSAAAVRIKTDVGRGGYITNVKLTDLRMERIKVPIRFSRGSNDHPDEGWDPKALPRIKGVHIANVIGFEVGKAPVLEGIKDAVFEDLCIRNVTLFVKKQEVKWQCEFVTGEAYDVSPVPCEDLRSNSSSSWCRES
ncbi:probable polygalacturonase [Zingiber officinale]|uniref:probable polygalacturonase n=1 Tax=Zingiber officinale TaxID=94328 RepID=UPI001C4BDC76|nr:probable polygalacturonase [Zingiber officinale]